MTKSRQKVKRASTPGTPLRRTKKSPNSALSIRQSERRIDQLNNAIARLTTKKESLVSEVASLTRRDSAETTKRKRTIDRLAIQLRVLKIREQERLDRAVTRFAQIQRKLDEVPYVVTIHSGIKSVTEPGRRWWNSPVTYSQDQYRTEKRRFSELLRGKTAPHDQPRFEKARHLHSDATNKLAEAKNRSQSVLSLIALGPDDVYSDPRLPTAILNLIATRDSIDKSQTRKKLRGAEHRLNDITDQIIQKQNEASQLQESIKQLESSLSTKQGSTPPPPQRLLMQWSDAETLAKEYCRWLGYQRAVLTGQGSDGGVDIDGPNLVAQVKMHNRPTSRPEIQQLYGIAAAENKRALFFSMSYSSDARSWADKVGVRLYQFTRDGTVEAIGRAARNDAFEQL